MIVRETEERDLRVQAKLMTELGYPTSVEEMNRHLKGISADPSYCKLVAETKNRCSELQVSTPFFSLEAILG